MTNSARTDVLRQALDDDALLTILAKRLGTEVRDRLQGHHAKLDARRFVLPTAGIQGSGKSTLLNALSFKRLVLPVEADETTAVPVEIVYAAAPSRMAKVLYRDGRASEVPATSDALAAVVDQVNNPANEQGVERVVVESSSPLLATGLVLVDLPGVGSLTRANAETALRYLDEAVGVLVMLRTVPPLTQSESLFVGGAWARLPTAFFVQNRWTDETNREAESGRQHNENVLRKIAEANHLRLDKPPQIHVVTAYNALRARLEDDAELAQRSGLLALEEVLGYMAKAWPELVRETIRAAVAGEVQAALAAVQREQEDLAKDRDRLARDIAAEEQRFGIFMAELDRRFAEARQLALNFKRDEDARLDAWQSETRSELRNAMRTKFRAGIVDGKRLAHALRAEEDEALDTVFAMVNEDVLVFRDRLGERLADLQGWSPTRSDTTQTVEKPAEAKWESLLPHAGGAAVGLAGGMGAAVLGGKIGAGIGAAGGPIGMAIGGVVGALVGGIFGSWLGKKGAEHKLDDRIRQVEGPVFAAVDRFTEDARQSFAAQVDELGVQTDRALRAWRQAQQAAFDRARAARVSTLNDTAEERRARAAGLETDRMLLSDWVARLSTRSS